MKFLLFGLLFITAAFVVSAQQDDKARLLKRAHDLLLRAHYEIQILKNAGQEQQAAQLLRLETQVQHLADQIQHFDAQSQNGQRALQRLERDLAQEEQRLEEELKRLTNGDNGNRDNHNLKTELLRRAVQLILRARVEHAKLQQTHQDHQLVEIARVEVDVLELEVQLIAISPDTQGSEQLLLNVEKEIALAEVALESELYRLRGGAF